MYIQYMSNANHLDPNDAPWERQMHAWMPQAGKVACGRSRHAASSAIRREVTCRRCLASLAKRDREFQRKARRGLLSYVYPLPSESFTAPWDAARAIAREEGRAL